MIQLAVLFLGAAIVSDLVTTPVRAKRTWRVGPYILQRELWCELCLERGVGPWSNERFEQSICEDLPERLLQYIEESELRRQLPAYDYDSPPEGATQLVHESWKHIEPIEKGSFRYDTMSLQIWRTDAPDTFGVVVPAEGRQDHPWVMHLDVATHELKDAMDQADRQEALRALENVKFCMGRVSGELLSVTEELGHEDLELQAARAMERATVQLQRAHQAIGTQYGVLFAPLLTMAAGAMAQPAAHAAVAGSVARHAVMRNAVRRKKAAHASGHYGADEESYGLAFIVPLLASAIPAIAGAAAKGGHKGKMKKAERLAFHKQAVQARLMKKLAEQQAVEQAAAAKKAAAEAVAKAPATQAASAPETAAPKA